MILIAVQQLVTYQWNDHTDISIKHKSAKKSKKYLLTDHLCGYLGKIPKSIKKKSFATDVSRSLIWHNSLSIYLRYDSNVIFSNFIDWILSIND